MTATAAPHTLRPVRARLGLLAFWGSSLAVGLAAFVVLAVLARTGSSGDLAAASALMSFSFVVAVVPGAIQLRAAADAAAAPDDGPAIPAALLGWSTAALLVAAPVIAALLTVPIAAVALLALQYGGAGVVSAQRGYAIGRADHGAASLSMATESTVRVVVGVALGIAFGPTGLALAFLLGTLAAGAAGVRTTGTPRRSAARAVGTPAVGVGLVMVLVNFDAFVAPRVLGRAGADAYALAELPARGTFFVLFAVSWLAVPYAVRATTRMALLVPIGALIGLGAAVGLTLQGVRPLLPIALGGAAPPAGLLALLVAAMTVAAALATALAMAVARDARRPWLATLIGSGMLAAAVLGGVATSPERLAATVLLAACVALSGTVFVLLRTGALVGARPGSSALLSPQ